MPIRSTSVFKDVTELRAAERREREMERQPLGTLAGGVAHDLNNTLVPILALTKLTANRLPAESRERSNLVTVMEACERARSLVQRILAFSREQNSEKRAFDLAVTVREALRFEIYLPLAPPVAHTGHIHKGIEEARAAKSWSIPAAPAPNRIARQPATAARSR